MSQYEKASDQKINLEKSIVSFSPNVPEETQSVLCSMLGMANSMLAEKYLGVPAIISATRRPFSNMSKIRFEGDCVVGTESFCHEGERNSLESSGLSHTILCDECFSSTYLSFVQKWKER